MTREYKYDNMKALLIFLVVFGHIVSRFAYESEVGRIVYNIIYSFHLCICLLPNTRLVKSVIK